MSIGPVYPNLAHLTPKNFGKEISQSVMGFQQAMCYAGIMTMPSLFGLLAEYFSAALLPYYLIALFALYALAFTTLMKQIKRN